MNEAYNKGFLKRASEYGISQQLAYGLLKQAGVMDALQQGGANIGNAFQHPMQELMHPIDSSKASYAKMQEAWAKPGFMQIGTPKPSQGVPPPPALPSAPQAGGLQPMPGEGQPDRPSPAPPGPPTTPISGVSPGLTHPNRGGLYASQPSQNGGMDIQQQLLQYFQQHQKDMSPMGPGSNNPYFA